MPAPRLAGVEIGGTKAIAVLADGGAIIERLVIPTTTPGETLGALVDQVERWNDAAPVAALGIASFGPIRLARAASDFGQILATTKPGWSGAPVFAPFAKRFSFPIAIDTDVDAAALAEYRWGSGKGCSSLVYVTIGTGIGGGVLVDGRSLTGRLHPELGHIRLRRDSSDRFGGDCPFHGDCVEGLLSGPALVARFGEDPASVAPDDPRWTAASFDLAEFIAVLIHGFAPDRLLVGGGVGLGSPHLLAQAMTRVPAILSGYYPDLDADALAAIVTAPALGADAGPLGSIALAMEAEAARP
jgi:fructokinase